MGSEDSPATLFRENVRFLLRSKYLSQADAAKQIDVSYKWLRRLCHHGLERIDKRSKKNLERVARFFDVSVDDLWNADLQTQPAENWVLIKWAGSKRRQAQKIVEQFPRSIKTYWEPFVGSGAVLKELLTSDIEVKRIRYSDICEPLIGIWYLIKDDPGQLADAYAGLWEKLQTGEQRLYNRIRDRFNKTGDPCDFFFLLRTCRIGFVQFSQSGEFNTPYHLGEMGMEPEKVNALLAEWHELLRRRDVTFTVRDYSTVFSRAGDFLYLDPPYPSARAQLYQGRFNHGDFFVWLRKQRAGWALSLNGPDGDGKYRGEVPEDLFDERFALRNGNSPARRLNRMDAPDVADCLYVRKAATIQSKGRNSARSKSQLR